MNPKFPPDKRALLRVDVAGRLLTLEVEGVRGCALLDVHSEGFAIATNARFSAGQRVRVAGSYGGQHFSGMAEIRYARALNDGRFRCGLQTGMHEQGLRRALRAIAVAMVREQLEQAEARR